VFERLFDFLIQCWNHIVPFTIVIQSQNAGVLRFGVYHRTLEPGFHWKWPFVEEVNAQNTCVTTLRLPPQTLTTCDGRIVVVSAIVKYQIKDVKPYITEIWDQTDVLADVTLGAVRKVVNATAYDAVVRDPHEDEVLKAVRAEVNKYGFRVMAITFTDLAEVWSVRLIQPHSRDLSN